MASYKYSQSNYLRIEWMLDTENISALHIYLTREDVSLKQFHRPYFLEQIAFYRKPSFYSDFVQSQSEDCHLELYLYKGSKEM